MRKVVFLDRDGTLNRDHGYTYRLEDFEFLPGVVSGLRRLQDIGYDLVILTNQSGIGRGMYDEMAYHTFMSRLFTELKEAGVHILGHYFCPHHPTDAQGAYAVDCDCRKPKPGLATQAAKEWGPFDYEKSWAVGDAVRDIEAVKNVDQSVRGVLLPKNAGTSSEKLVDQDAEADFIVHNFREAVDTILQYDRTRQN